MDPRDLALRSTIDSGDTADLVTLETLAEESQISLPILEALTREGLLAPRVEQPRMLYHRDDAAVVGAGLELVSAGLPLAELFEMARRANQTMQPLAEDAVDVFVKFVGDPAEGTAETHEEAAERIAQALERMLPAVGQLVSHHFQRLLVEVARNRLQED